MFVLIIEYITFLASFCHAVLLVCTDITVKDCTSMFMLEFIPGCAFSL